jgi:hypothetical protein
MNKLLTIASVLFLAACGSGERSESSLSDTSLAVARDGTEALSPADTSGTSFGRFSIYYEQLINSLLTNDAPAFNRFIHPEYGLCIIESSGAMPQMRNGKDISRFKTLHGKSLFELDKTGFRCELKEEELPKVDCDKEGFFTKEGCFTQEINTFRDEKIWEHCNLRENEQALAASAAETITRTVINTKGFRFYFSRIGNQWFLTFLDLRVPCSA